jgi:hypothetical protein
MGGVVENMKKYKKYKMWDMNDMKVMYFLDMKGNIKIDDRKNG